MFNPIVYPTGNYIIGTDHDLYASYNNLLSYNIETGELRNLTTDLPIPEDQESYYPTIKEKGIMCLSFLKDEEGVIVCDKYDIWKLDLKGKNKAICLTNGYGRANNLNFRLLPTQISDDFNISEGKELFVTIFNAKNKDAGFGRITMSSAKNPAILNMGPFFYSSKRESMVIRKAQKSERYVVQRETASKSPNYFLTKDFKELYAFNKC